MLCVAVTQNPLLVMTKADLSTNIPEDFQMSVQVKHIPRCSNVSTLLDITAESIIRSRVAWRNHGVSHDMRGKYWTGNIMLRWCKIIFIIIPYKLPTCVHIIICYVVILLSHFIKQIIYNYKWTHLLYKFFYLQTFVWSRCTINFYRHLFCIRFI